MTGSMRAAWALFACHAGLILFSTAAMVTVLNGASPVDLNSEPAATVMRISFRFAGPSYVILGGLTALVFLGAMVGWRKGAAVAVTAATMSLVAELVGTSVALPFGDYSYSGLLGYRVMGLVPFPIPISWFYMLVGCLVIVVRMTARSTTPWRVAVGAGLLMVAWDLSLEPAMVNTGHWQWNSGAMFQALPAWVNAFFTRDAFYGMPLSNWLGWFITAAVIARVMLLIIPAAEVRASAGTSSLPVALYLANGVMPVALCLRDGLWWAAALGSAAMLIPSLIALRNTDAAPARTAAQPAT
ncbi:MAG TPA: carotenoid biosynthesis protein [Gemmatimonadaceae bacterium]